MKSPVFSIVIATCRRPRLLERAVRSVLGQTFGDFECLVVDDSGDPGAADIRGIFPDSRLVFIRHETNKGMTGAVNSGLKASRGSLITVLGDDDEFYPSFMEKMNAFFEKAPARIGFAWTGVRRVRDAPAGEILLCERVWPSEFGSGEAAVIAATTIGNGFGVTMRRECLDNVGSYNESFRVSGDTEYLFRLAGNFECMTIPEILVKIHHHENNQLTHRDNERLRMEQYERILTANAGFIAHFPKLFDIHYQRLAQLCYSQGMRKKARGILLQRWRNGSRCLSLIPESAGYEFLGSRRTVWILAFLKRQSERIKKVFSRANIPPGERGRE